MILPKSFLAAEAMVEVKFYHLRMVIVALDIAAEGRKGRSLNMSVAHSVCSIERGVIKACTGEIGMMVVTYVNVNP